MDAHVFRVLAKELVRFTQGARIEKIHGPDPGILSLRLYNYGLKRNLILQYGSGSPCLYLSARQLPNPQEPGTKIMTLRKHLAGARLGTAMVDWLQRRIYFKVLRSTLLLPLWLLLDLKKGPELTAEQPEQPVVCWPSCIDEITATSTDKAEIWKLYPVLTPGLRKALALLDAPDANALLADLQYETEQNSNTLYLCSLAGQPQLLSVWPLLSENISGLSCTELQSGAIFSNTTDSELKKLSDELLFPVLDAARKIYEPQVLANLGLRDEKNASLHSRQAEKRLLKLLLKLDKEKERFQQMQNLRAQAIAIQSNLWRYSPETRLKELCFSAEETPTGQYLQITLDPLLTLRENMAKLFRQSDRGARGLEHLKKRRKEIEQELEKWKSGTMACLPAKNQQKKTKDHKKSKSLSPQNISNQVQRFISSDGFTILRGRSAKGNQTLLKLALGHDLWLHVQDGPSAHVVIRRDNLGVDIPEQTLHEAGILSALKSWRKNDSKAEIMCALVKDVRPVKGGAPGSVLVDKSLHSFRVNLNPELEKKLLQNLQDTE